MPSDAKKPSVRQDFVKGGGTSTSANDARKARERAEADRRRAEHDAKTRASAGTVETKRDETGAQVVKTASDIDKQHYAAMYTRNIGGMSDNAAIVLRVDAKDGTVLDYIMANLLVDDAALGTFKLVIVCPSCLHRHRRPVDDCQITMRSDHRRFSLHEKHRGALWVNPKPPHEALTLAGSIETQDVQTCPVCAFRFEIGPAKLGPGDLIVSGVVKEA